MRKAHLRKDAGKPSWCVPGRVSGQPQDDRQDDQPAANCMTTWVGSRSSAAARSLR
jgi:hypothetical protein